MFAAHPTHTPLGGLSPVFRNDTHRRYMVYSNKILSNFIGMHVQWSCDMTCQLKNLLSEIDLKNLLFIGIGPNHNHQSSWNRNQKLMYIIEAPSIIVSIVLSATNNLMFITMVYLWKWRENLAIYPACHHRKRPWAEVKGVKEAIYCKTANISVQETLANLAWQASR